MTELPMPLVPAHVDLSDFPFMPLMIAKLKQSRAWLICKRRPEMAFYLINIWTASWHARPAGSLEDDDLVLADLAMCTDDVWQEVRADALRGWIKCSDGRLYHPVIAEQAVAAWDRKVAHRERTAAATAARAAKRAEAQKERNEQRNVDRDDHGNDERHVYQGTGTGTGTGTVNNISSSFHSEEIIVDLAAPNKPEAEKPKRTTKPRTHPYPNDAFDRWYADYPHKVGKGAAKKAFAKVQASDSVGFTELIEGLRRYKQSKPRDQPWCNPATWLNEDRWSDAPAHGSSASSLPFADTGNSIDFGNGCSAPRETIRKIWSSGRWPQDWGPMPGQQGCRIPIDMIEELTRGGSG